MMPRNNVLQMINQVKKMIGNGDPNQFLQNYVQQMGIPQSALSQAQQEARQIVDLISKK